MTPDQRHSAQANDLCPQKRSCLRSKLPSLNDIEVGYFIMPYGFFPPLCNGGNGCQAMIQRLSRGQPGSQTRPSVMRKTS